MYCAFTSRVARSAARDVRRRLDDGRADRHVLREADLRARLRLRADRLHGEAMPEHGVMPRLVEAARRQLQPGRVDADAIAELDERAELVDREDVLHAIGQMLRDVARVVAERLRRVARLPAAAVVLQRLRQVPVIERRERLDAVGEQLVDEPVVEVEALRVRRAVALREHARPRDREAIGLDAQRLHQLHVLLVAMVVVVGDVARWPLLTSCRACARTCPRPTAAAVFGGGALDLIRGGRGPQRKPGGKLRPPGPCGLLPADDCGGTCAPNAGAAAAAPSAAAPAALAKLRRVTGLDMSAVSPSGALSSHPE